MAGAAVSVLLALLVAAFGSPEALLTFCLVQLGLSLICGTHLIARDCSSFAQNLQRNGSLDEVEGTSTSVVSLFDGAAYCALRQAARSGIWLLGLFDAWLLYRAGFEGSLALAVFWPVVFLLGAATSVYGMLTQVAWRSESAPWAGPLVSSLPLLTVMATLFQALKLFSEKRFGLAGLAVLFTFYVCILLCRFLGQLGLRLLPELPDWSFPSANRSKGLYSHFARGSGNPILWREYTRVRGSEMVRSHLLAVVAGSAMICLSRSGVDAGVLVLAFLAALLQSAYSAMGIVCREREAKTLDALLQTGVTAQQFIDGVLRVSVLPRQLEMATLGGLAVAADPGFLHLLQFRHPEPNFVGYAGFILAATACSLFVLRGAAIMGLYAGTRQFTRRKAVGQTVVNLALWYMTAIGCLVALGLAALWCMSPVASRILPTLTLMWSLVYLLFTIGWFFFVFWGIPGLALGRVRKLLTTQYGFSA
jgi:hypothetical protein